VSNNATLAVLLLITTVGSSALGALQLWLRLRFLHHPGDHHLDRRDAGNYHGDQHR
jgi:hypothetical protein